MSILIFIFIFILGVLGGIILGDIFPRNIDIPLFWKMVRAYFPCRAIYFSNGWRNGKLGAIKKYRELTGQGLLATKEQIEKWFEK